MERGWSSLSFSARCVVVLSAVLIYIQGSLMLANWYKSSFLEDGALVGVMCSAVAHIAAIVACFKLWRRWLLTLGVVLLIDVAISAFLLVSIAYDGRTNNNKWSFTLLGTLLKAWYIVCLFNTAAQFKHKKSKERNNEEEKEENGQKTGRGWSSLSVSARCVIVLSFVFLYLFGSVMLVEHLRWLDLTRPRANSNATYTMEKHWVRKVLEIVTPLSYVLAIIACFMRSACFLITLGLGYLLMVANMGFIIILGVWSDNSSLYSNRDMWNLLVLVALLKAWFIVCIFNASAQFISNSKRRQEAAKVMKQKGGSLNSPNSCDSTSQI